MAKRGMGALLYYFIGLNVSLITICFQFGNRQFWASSRKSRDCAEAYAMYAAQEIPQIDAEIAQKGHFRMETILPV